MPANGKAYSLNLVNNVLYSTTAQGCGGNPNLLYSFDLATKKVTTYMGSSASAIQAWNFARYGDARCGGGS